MSTFLELKNQHLILFHGIAENQKALIFVFEFAAEGPLDEYIRKERWLFFSDCCTVHLSGDRELKQPCLFLFCKRSLPFLTVNATIGNQAFSHDSCNIFPGLRYKK